jgi:catechol 2,3-dioxygenase-like lactoylglutathione lyase family enzyme
VLFPAGAHAQANPEKPVGFEIAWNHVALSVPNIAESIAWYEKMLGFKGTVRRRRPAGRAVSRSRIFARATSHRTVPGRGRAPLPSRGRTHRKTSARTG